MHDAVQPRRTHGRRFKALGIVRLAAMEQLANVEIKLDGITAGTLNPKIFSPAQTTHLEIGFGSGEHVTELAAQNPDDLFLAAEPYTAGVANLMKTITEQNLNNIRIYPNDGLALLRAVKSHAIDHAYLLFPDPWPKQRHHTRRFIQTETVAEFARVIRPGGTLLLASDDTELVTWMRRHMENHPEFTAAPEYTHRPQTRYAAKAVAADKTLNYMAFLRR